jgi:hypothetical protein
MTRGEPCSCFTARLIQFIAVLTLQIVLKVQNL